MRPWKCYILVATQELVHCLICLHSPLGAVRPRASAYISGNALVPVLQPLHVTGWLVSCSHDPYSAICGQLVDIKMIMRDATYFAQGMNKSQIDITR